MRGQDSAPLVPVCQGWSPITPKTGLTSVPRHRHYFQTLQTSLRQLLDSGAAQTVVGVPPGEACCLADFGQHLPKEIVSHGLPRVPDSLLVKQLLVLFDPWSFSGNRRKRSHGSFLCMDLWLLCDFLSRWFLWCSLVSLSFFRRSLMKDLNTFLNLKLPELSLC